MKRGFLHLSACALTALLAVTFVAVAPASADAADQSRFFANQKDQSTARGFFVKGSARTTFGDRAAEEAPAAIQFFPRKPVAEEEQPDAKLQPASLSQPQDAVANTDKTKATPEAQRDSLVKEYGNPEEEAPVKAQETAPKPFRGMMAALEAGDDELARSYARQYVRYMDRLQKRTGESVDIIFAAREREGLMEEGAIAASSTMAKHRAAYQQAALAEDKDAFSLDDKAAALLREVQSGNEREEKSPAALNVEANDSAETPADMRRQLAGKVPVDAGSKVEILFFFRPYDSKSQLMARELQGLYQAALKLGGRSITAIPLEEITPEQEQHFRARTGITFPVNPAGSSLAALMDIRSVPATALMSPRLNQAFVVSGVRKTPYVLEALHMMEGR